jgi:type IX secretion system PorP/SprF family membrane protein
MNWRADWSVLRYRDPRELDASFSSDTPNKWLPNFGAGIFYYAPKYYIGFSVPQLISWELGDVSPTGTNTSTRSAQYYRHFYFSAGAAFPLNGDALYFKPSILIKSVGLLGELASQSKALNVVGAPTEFDLDLSLLFFESLWLGTSFRSAFSANAFGGESSFDSIDFWGSFYLRNGLRIGMSYDYTISKLRPVAGASYEIMLGYDFNFTDKKVTTPRYF